MCRHWLFSESSSKSCDHDISSSIHLLSDDSCSLTLPTTFSSVYSCSLLTAQPFGLTLTLPLTSWTRTMPCYCSKCEGNPHNNFGNRTIKQHLGADQRSLELCSEVEKHHREYCIYRNTQFLLTGNDQSGLIYQGVLDWTWTPVWMVKYRYNRW